jgi:hypothetical protein
MRVVTLPEFNALTENGRGCNYLVNCSRNRKFFSLGNYKTKGTYGEKRILCTSKLNAVLNLYLRLHTHSHLLLNAKGETLTANQLTKYLHRTFELTGKKISCCMLRHIFISEFMTGPSLKERAKVSERMAHSLSTQELYKKHDLKSSWYYTHTMSGLASYSGAVSNFGSNQESVKNFLDNYDSGYYTDYNSRLLSDFKQRVAEQSETGAKLVEAGEATESLAAGGIGTYHAYRLQAL